MENICNSLLEFKSRDEIEKLQAEYLRQTVKYVNDNSPFYKKELPNIQSLDDLSLLPITTKEQLQTYNSEFYCVQSKDITEIVTTTGTTGQPVFIALTKEDLDRLALNEARSFYGADVTPNDNFHIAVTLDSLFIAGMAYYLGITRLGASVYRAGMYNVKRHIELIKKLKPTGIVTVPSFLVKLIEGLCKQGIDPSTLSVQKALLVGDSIRDNNFSLNPLGSLITKSWPIELYSTYGNSEGGISFCECSKHTGCHEHPDLIISEILDDNGKPVAEGQLGELVLTTLQNKGMPLLRYCTGDITFKLISTCSCGRNSSRIGPILGRKAQMMKFKGVKIYPKLLENALINIDGVSNYVIECLTGDDFSDRIIVRIGCDKPDKSLKQRVCSHIQAYAKVAPEVELMPAEEVENLQTQGGTRRKPRIFIDRRQHAQ